MKGFIEIKSRLINLEDITYVDKFSSKVNIMLKNKSSVFIVGTQVECDKIYSTLRDLLKSRPIEEFN